MTQPEALRLAEFCDGNVLYQPAAAELRRQHEEITQLRHGAGVANRCIADIASQRDALLEALKYHQEQTRPIQRTIDAIAKAEENT